MVTLGDLAVKKIKWIAKSPHQRYVKDEVSRVAGGDEPGGPNASPSTSRPGLAFGKAAAGIGDEGKDDVLAKLSQLEKRKPEAKETATVKTPKGEDSKKEKKIKKGRVLTPKKTPEGGQPAGWFGKEDTPPDTSKSSETTNPSKEEKRDTSQTKKKKNKKMKKQKERGADCGPFGVGANVTYGAKFHPATPRMKRRIFAKPPPPEAGETRRSATAANADLGGQGGRGDMVTSPRNEDTPRRLQLGPGNPRAKSKARALREGDEGDSHARPCTGPDRSRSPPGRRRHHSRSIAQR